MKSYNLTVDNVFRNPFRWRRCPINYNKPCRIYGIKISYNEMMPTSFKNRWIVVIYFHKWYKAWSNYPLNY